MNIASVSSKGQIVIPKKIRKELGIKSSDKFFVMQKEDSIILKKIDEEKAKEKMLELMDYFTEEFKKAGITREDVNEAIKWANSKNDQEI